MVYLPFSKITILFFRRSTGHVFDESSLFNGKPKAIVIEGNPGSGKTTLMERYAWEWAEKRAEPFINDLALLIICQGSTIKSKASDTTTSKTNQEIEASIEDFLSEFDEQGSLYKYYIDNKESCLVIFEAMDEASEEARELMVQYVKGRPAGQPIIITGRTDCFKRTPIPVDLLAERCGFSKDQAITYFKQTFPYAVPDVENLIDSGTISADFLESPYNCKYLGLLLNERQRTGGRNLHGEGGFSITLLMKSIFIDKLERVKLTSKDSLFQNLSHLALWATLEEKHTFTETNLQEFNLACETVFTGFLCRHARRAGNYYTFPHETEKDYLAALALTELVDGNKRDAFYQIFASDRKYAAILRFAAGLLSEETLRDGKDFQMMFAHAKLLGGITHHESTHKKTVLEYSKTLVKAILKTFMGGNGIADCTGIPEPEIMSSYTAECDHFISATFTEAEKQAFLDSCSESTCISSEMLDIFIDFYLRLNELSVPNKGEFDMIRRIIGDGIT